MILDTDVEHTLPVQTFGELETELGKENFIIQGNVILNAGGSVQLAVNTVKVWFFYHCWHSRGVPVLGLCGCVMDRCLLYSDIGFQDSLPQR